MNKNLFLSLFLICSLSSVAPGLASNNPEWIGFYQSKKYDQALFSLDKLVELNVDEDKKSLLWSRSNINVQLKKFDDAVEDCNKALVLSKSDPWTYHVRSMAYAANHDEKNAISDANKAIELSGNQLTYIINRALVYKMLGNNKKAIDDYSEAISKAPEYGPAYYFRGELLQKEGKLEEAKTDFNFAKKYGFELGEDYLSRDSAK